MPRSGVRRRLRRERQLEMRASCRDWATSVPRRVPDLEVLLVNSIDEVPRRDPTGEPARLRVRAEMHGELDRRCTCGSDVKDDRSHGVNEERQGQGVVRTWLLEANPTVGRGMTGGRSLGPTRHGCVPVLHLFDQAAGRVPTSDRETGRRNRPGGVAPADNGIRCRHGEPIEELPVPWLRGELVEESVLVVRGDGVVGRSKQLLAHPGILLGGGRSARSRTGAYRGSRGRRSGPP